MLKRGRGRPKKLGLTHVSVGISTEIADLMRDIARLSGRTMGDTYNDFLTGALPALLHTKALYEDLARLPSESRAAFVESLNDKVAILENAVQTAKQIDIFDKQ